MLLPILLPLFFSATKATAQQITDSTTSFQTDSSSDPARNSLSASFMNITFSPSSSAICSASPNSSSSSALSIAIRTLPQTRACFSLSETFSNPSTTYTSSGTGRCDSKLGLCGIKYTVFNTLPSHNDIENGDWSHVFYTQVRNPLDEGGEMDGEGEGGRLELEVFDREGCEMDKGEGVRWNCVEGRGSCGGVGFGVRSFRVGLMEAGDVGVGGCVVGQTGSGGESLRRVEMGGMAVIWAAVVVGLGMM